MILLDVHRPENFNYTTRLQNIFDFANKCAEKYNIPVKMLYFKRLKDAIDNNGLDLGKIELVPLYGYKEYLETVYHCRFIISDSGTGQEEPALLETPVIVPRDFTERPQSYVNHCSIRFCAETGSSNQEEIFHWLDLIENRDVKIDSTWLGDGNTSKMIANQLLHFLQ
jgi:UDP-N-acetylglucosamine 2-epimerase